MGLQINRVIDVDGICTYLDQEVQVAAFVLMAYGFDLEEFDTFLGSVKESKRLTQFLEWRSHAIHAIKTHNENAAEGWCNALNASRFEYMRSKSLLPLALKGDKQRKDGRKAAQIKYENSGFPEKKLQAQALWASGKYKSRDICAEEESAAIGLPFSTFREYLRNTPDPQKD